MVGLCLAAFLRAEEAPAKLPSPPMILLSELRANPDCIRERMREAGVSEYAFARIGPSGSMRPVLDNYDYVIVSDTPFDALQLHDIVLRADYQGLVACHRLSMIGKDAHLTKGDNNLRHDRGLLVRQNYKGRIVLIVKNDIGEHHVQLLAGAKLVLAQSDLHMFGASARDKP